MLHAQRRDKLGQQVRQQLLLLAGGDDVALGRAETAWLRLHKTDAWRRKTDEARTDEPRTDEPPPCVEAPPPNRSDPC
jgi:hypothetical protein